MTVDRRIGVTLALCAMGTLSLGCRDDVPPFEAEDRSAAAPGRLTFSTGDDRSPAWSMNGDSIYYSAEGFGHLPPAPGVLVGLPAGGGITRPILTNVQSTNIRGRQRWLVAPAPSPDGERLAFVEVVWLHDESNYCDPSRTALVCDPPRAAAALPPLGAIAVRARRLDATHPLDDDPQLVVRAAGVERIEGPNPYEAAVFHIVRNFPFQQLFDQERSFFFRASWAPDGNRVVLSDGLRLLIWAIDSGSVTAVPGAEDASGPAWSQDGEWIAFSRLERADSSRAVCLFVALGVACAQERTDYAPGKRILTIVRPDGSEVIELGEGDEPAWAPDARTLFFRRDDRIWKISLDGGAPSSVQGTEGAREPAVSPDARYLAFARPGTDGDYDIWVVSLMP